MSDSLQSHGLYCSWNSPGQNIGMSSLSLFQGIFLTQGSNPGLPHWDSLPAEPQGKRTTVLLKTNTTWLFATGKELGGRRAVMAPQCISMCPYVLIPVKQQQCLQISVSCPIIEVTSKDTASRVTWIWICGQGPEVCTSQCIWTPPPQCMISKNSTFETQAVTISHTSDSFYRANKEWVR